MKYPNADGQPIGSECQHIERLVVEKQGGRASQPEGIFWGGEERRGGVVSLVFAAASEVVARRWPPFPSPGHGGWGPGRGRRGGGGGAQGLKISPRVGSGPARAICGPQEVPIWAWRERERQPMATPMQWGVKELHGAGV